jgi:hypothetical protein
MTDTKLLNPAKAGELAQRIVKVLADADSETRRRAIEAALTLLGEKSVASPLVSASHGAGRDGTNTQITLGDFFNRREKLRPAEHAQLCAAYHYSIYGLASFSLDDIRTIGKDAGVVLPDRLDMTLQQATKGGKKLFQSIGRGLFKPTAAAGMFFHEKWGVRPGAKTKS